MRFEEFKDMLKSGDLEQIRPHLAFEMMSADSPKTERYNDCPVYCHSRYVCNTYHMGIT